MAQIGPLLTIVQSAFTAPDEVVAQLLGGLDAPPLPAHLDVINGRAVVHVFVTAAEGALSDQLPEVQRHGFRLRTRTARVACGWIYLDAIGEIAEAPSGAYVEAAGVVRPELDVSVPEARNIGAAGVVPFPTGSDVLIGIVDTGVDVTHPSLCNSIGATRVLRYWDQAATGGQFPAGLGYGAEWSAGDIDACHFAGPPFPAKDVTGHGTAVAGVAAANGLASPSGRYVGVATDANLVVVALQAPAHAFASSNNVVDACRYVFDVAAQFGCRAVVNLSSGARLGAHDAHGEFELAISDLLAENPEHILVNSAGNLGAASAHARFTVPDGGSHDLVFTVPRFAGRYVALDIWYALADRIAIELVDPTGARSATVEGHNRDWGTLTDSWAVSGVLNVPHVQANQVLVTLQAGTNVTAGTWTVRVHGRSVTSGAPVDAWLDTADGPPSFPAADPDCTITAPATADGVLAVSAYKMSPAIGPMAALSSRGPGRDGKPFSLIAAPGSPVTTCAAASRSTAKHARATGTSMAAAHVSGAIAAMLEVNPSLSRAAVIACLTGTARTDADTTNGPASAWGAGKLDIDAALRCAAQKTGGTP